MILSFVSSPFFYFSCLITQGIQAWNNFFSVTCRSKSLWFQKPVTCDLNKFCGDLSYFHVESMCAKSVLFSPSQSKNRFSVGSAYIEFHSGHAEHILNKELELGCIFPLCWFKVYIDTLGYAKIVYPVTESTRNSFWRTLSQLSIFIILRLVKAQYGCFYCLLNHELEPPYAPCKL